MHDVCKGRINVHAGLLEGCVHVPVMKCHVARTKLTVNYNYAHIQVELALEDRGGLPR